MPLFACTIFTSAFLLFLVQPIVAKEILPWFGGSAAVWTTCLVFFQVALLAGYTYSDFTTRRLTPRVQATLHIVLLIASVAVLPIIPDASWKPAGSEDPGLRILFTSGHTDDPVLRTVRHDPRAGFIAKPYRRAELARKLAEVMPA